MFNERFQRRKKRYKALLRNLGFHEMYVDVYADQILKNSQCFPRTKKLSQVFVSKQVDKIFKQ